MSEALSVVGAADEDEDDVKRASKKLRQYVEGNDHAIRLKAEIIVDHFHNQVYVRGKIGGEARAMVVTSSIERTVQYFQAIGAYLRERKSPYKPIVAFSGEHDFGAGLVTESSLNGFSSKEITDRIQEDPYRILICADKFQTGYDEPLLFAMYVDKALSGVKAVQTLLRLNRAHPQKYEVAVLDFFNNTDQLQKSFEDHYRTTVLSDETDPDKLHDLQAELDAAGIHTRESVERFVALYLDGVDRDRLDPILDVCQAAYVELNDFDEDGVIAFKADVKTFVRTYAFLSAILPYTNANWEKLSIFLTFLTFLIPKLPISKEDDLSAGILESIDMDSYRVEKRKPTMTGRTPASSTTAPCSRS